MASPRKALAIHHAGAQFERARDRLAAELDRDATRTCLDALVELCELYVECTGGTLRTLEFRAQLAALKTRVEARPHLRIVAMPYEIDVAATCVFCQHHGRLVVNGPEYECHCSYCYDPAEDGHLASRTRGMAADPRIAIDVWQDAQNELVPEHVGHWPSRVADIARAEFARTQDWCMQDTAAGRVWGPRQ